MSTDIDTIIVPDIFPAEWTAPEPEKQDEDMWRLSFWYKGEHIVTEPETLQLKVDKRQHWLDLRRKPWTKCRLRLAEPLMGRVRFLKYHKIKRMEIVK